MHEFDLIARIRGRAGTRADVVLGIGDDAALLQLPAGLQLAVAMDTLNAGVHFPPGTTPADIGWKALAVNLSDLAAMGAQPAWCTLALSLPEAEPAFIDAFLDGFLELADAHGIALVGGDTTRGPLSVCVTVHGFVESGTALRRDGAQPGDEVWVSGTLGDAAGALAQWREEEKRGQSHFSAEVSHQAEVDVRKDDSDPFSPLRTRLDRPTPRVALGRALRGIASTCIDVSDGLLADLGHICAASATGARIDVDALPASEALRHAFADEARRALQATGGDDYELCFTAQPALRAAVQALATNAVPVSRIGVIVADPGVQAVTADGARWQPACSGYRHFDD
jgi:thiamine-monophosphate kinase